MRSAPVNRPSGVDPWPRPGLRTPPPRAAADHELTHTTLRTPKAAAIAGLLFSITLTAIFAILRLSVSADVNEPGIWLLDRAWLVRLAAGLAPIAGIAFLWFVGVLRDRLGAREDRFFATIFLGSGLLFLSGLLALAAIVIGIVTAAAAHPEVMIGSPTYHFARAIAYSIVNDYMMKMGIVFIVTGSTVVLCTRIVPRSLAYAGYLSALVLIFGGYVSTWSFVAFPVWVALISGHILHDGLRRSM